MDTNKILSLIADFESQLNTLAAANTPRFKQKADFANKAINILKEARAEIHRAHREAADLRAYIDGLNHECINEARNHEATKAQNRKYIHLLKSAGVAYSSYQF